MQILDAITVSMMSSKPISYIPQSPRLLDQLREVLRYKHYSLRTEEAYLYWVKFFVRWHGRNGQTRHLGLTMCSAPHARGAFHPY